MHQKIAATANLSSADGRIGPDRCRCGIQATAQRRPRQPTVAADALRVLQIASSGVLTFAVTTGDKIAVLQHGRVLRAPTVPPAHGFGHRVRGGVVPVAGAQAVTADIGGDVAHAVGAAHDGRDHGRLSSEGIWLRCIVPNSSPACAAIRRREQRPSSADEDLVGKLGSHVHRGHGSVIEGRATDFLPTRAAADGAPQRPLQGFTIAREPDFTVVIRMKQHRRCAAHKVSVLEITEHLRPARAAVGAFPQSGWRSEGEEVGVVGGHAKTADEVVVSREIALQVAPTLARVVRTVHAEDIAVAVQPSARVDAQAAEPPTRIQGNRGKWCGLCRWRGWWRRWGHSRRVRAPRQRAAQ